MIASGFTRRLAASSGLSRLKVSGGWRFDGMVEILLAQLHHLVAPADLCGRFAQSKELQHSRRAIGIYVDCLLS